jgi:predicted RecB family nuclease
MPTLITDSIFAAYLQCETKAHLIAIQTAEPQHDISQWRKRLTADYKAQCLGRLAAFHDADVRYHGTPPLSTLKSQRYHFIINCTIGNDAIESHADALQRMTLADKSAPGFYVPIRVLPHDTITPNDKLLLAFDALALGTMLDSPPARGLIVHGSPQRTLTVDLSTLIETARHHIGEISTHLTQAPAHHLNRHCPDCAFQRSCHDIATSKDDLSLLLNMHKREREKQNRKGIFTVTQLSYTFRPRRRPSKQKFSSPLYNHPLKALAIRDNKIYVTACPTVDLGQTPIIYLDVEGDPGKQSYYLVGLRVCSGASTTQHSFWADSPSDEREMWTACLRSLAAVAGARVVCYGTFDRTFLLRMKTRYSEIAGSSALVDQLVKTLTNVVSLIYAHIYFPTYSNTLKDIANFLGFTWTHEGASGLHAMMWRSQWELSRGSALKDRLIAYNIDDCKALEMVYSAIARLSGEKADEALNTKRTADVVQVDSLKRKHPYQFQRTPYANAELDFINRCAYWDYQRNKVYVRTSTAVKKAVRRESVRRHRSVLPPNTTVIADQPGPGVCPKCGATSKLYKHERLARIVYDLRFTGTGVKRWVVRYRYSRYSCTACNFVFQVHRANEKYGPTLRALVLYYMIELRVPQNSIGPCVSQMFGLQLSGSAVTQMKKSGARHYEDLYAEMFKRVTNGRMLHVDETKVSIKGKEAFVWVFTNLEEVVYVYRASRDATFVREALSEFHGVLISDCYAGYEGISCPQQKCLIHFIRDLNDSLLKEPFNDELQTMTSVFSRLLREVIGSVDKFGLKTSHLRKHKDSVTEFYQTLASTDWKTEAVKTWRKRFEKNRNTLFTFLDYDGIPWNNNNAEHAVKKFVFLRHVMGGSSSEAGIREYLILLSVYESCEFKGIPFLEFLRSGERTFERFPATPR